MLSYDSEDVVRIAAHDRGSYLVADATGERRARISGALRHRAVDPIDLPVVGDRVRVQRDLAGATAIVEVLPRINLFARRAAGGAGDLQPIAANLDRLFVVAAVNRDFNLRRIERYLAAAASCSIPVAIALTKTDLVADVASYLSAASSVAAGAPVLALSALEDRGFDAFSAHRGKDRTIAFAGSSGAGKSTLINHLLGRDELATGAVRDGDDRGRHTTTRRELRFLSDGTAVIDTPGMRELSLAAGGNGLDAAFEDLRELAESCRFADCRHAGEPGCAVQAGADPERVRNWQKLNRELAFEQRKHDRRAAHDEAERWKALTVASRKTSAFRKRNGPR